MLAIGSQRFFYGYVTLQTTEDKTSPDSKFQLTVQSQHLARRGVGDETGVRRR